MEDANIVPPQLPPVQPCVTAVTIKLPPFWSSDPQVWFAQVEAQFAIKGINNQRTMFDYVIASLLPKVATKIRDLILTPPEANQYNAIKEQLIQQTAVSEQRRLQQLLGSEELGDRKPYGRGTSHVPTTFTPNISAISPSPLYLTKLQSEITCLKEEIKLLQRS